VISPIASLKENMAKSIGICTFADNPMVGTLHVQVDGGLIGWDLGNNRCPDAVREFSSREVRIP